MDPARLSRFIDAPLARGSASIARLQSQYGFAGEEPYQQPRQQRPFAKFDEGTKRAVRLEQTAVGGVFGRPMTAVRAVPVRQAEEIVGSAAARAATASARRKSRSGSGKRVVQALEANTFRLGHVRQPVVVDEPEVPVIVPETSVPNPTKQGIMLPSQRRAMMAQEVRIQRAAKLRRKAKNDRQRMIDLMRTRHPVGVMGMDSPVARGTLAYGELASSLKAMNTTAAMTQQRRARQLRAKEDGTTRRGYNALVHSSSSPARHEKLSTVFQGKGRAGHHVDSFNRLFEAPPPDPDDPARRTYIRNHQTQGRRYNVVTGTDLVHVPPSKPEYKDKSLKHPSMISQGYTLKR